ncbi:family 1 glycosylhydrolase [Nocardia stercoris]|uniref:Glycoside hydrolase family 1 protein n=1 Tax=Nocardia stercoris TaxID=2483361 RepID=A0A3M2KU05_9NOCA|nr:family 1 glycosylhydrolase [Nocardia stercoris]RMI28601.1 glycoside hydrolase family 1 protein [Nocardia stercoris]
MRSLNRRHALAVLAGGAAALAVPWSRAGARPLAPTEIAPLGSDFMWGVASAGFQCEGHAPDSNWSRYVQQQPWQYEPVRDSVDFYTRYSSDIDLAVGLGVNVYRISVEWARVQPRRGVWDEDGFAFYDAVLDTLAAAGIRPMLTLDHWVYPGWAADRGGWGHPDMVGDWLANARKVVDRYASRNPLWVTFNESTIYTQIEVANLTLPLTSAPMMQQGVDYAHNTIYDYIHQVQPGAMVTMNIAFTTGTTEPVFNGLLFDPASRHLDYIGIDYYDGFSAGTLPPFTPGPLGKAWQKNRQPEGVYYALSYYANRYPGLPLYIVENGIATQNGLPRPDGITRADDLRDTVYWLQRAKADGFDVIGYNYWSITDNYEWGSYDPRFGLYTVDVVNDPFLTRRPTDAVAAYSAITRNGGVPADFRPAHRPVDCSWANLPDSCSDPVRLPDS